MNIPGKNKEEWIDETMNSFIGVHRVEAPGNLFHKIEQRLYGKRVLIEGRIVPFRFVSAAAALIILLISVNLFVVARPYKMNGERGRMKEIAEYYGFKNNDILNGL